MSLLINNSSRIDEARRAAVSILPSLITFSLLRRYFAYHSTIASRLHHAFRAAGRRGLALGNEIAVANSSLRGICRYASRTGSRQPRDPRLTGWRHRYVTDIDIARRIADPSAYLSPPPSSPDARVKRIAPGSRLRAQTRGDARLTERKRFTEIASEILPAEARSRLARQWRGARVFARRAPATRNGIPGFLEEADLLPSLREGSDARGLRSRGSRARKPPEDLARTRYY